MTPPDPVTLQRLAQAHGFRLDALPANRAGFMTAAQVKGLRKDRRFVFVIFACFSLASFVVEVVSLLGVGGPPHLEYALAGLALALLLGFWLLRQVGRWRQGGRTVAVEESFLQVSSSATGDGPDTPEYYYRTSTGITLHRATAEGAALIDPGQRYRVYYSPGSNELVNIEPIGGTFSGAPALLSEAEVSAILGVPVRLEQRGSQSTPSESPMRMMHFSNPILQVGAILGIRLGGQSDRSTQVTDAWIRQRGERVADLGEEAYFDGGQLFV